MYRRGGLQTHPKPAGKMQFHYRLAFDERADLCLQVFDTVIYPARCPSLVYDEKRWRILTPGRRITSTTRMPVCAMEKPHFPRGKRGGEATGGGSAGSGAETGPLSILPDVTQEAKAYAGTNGKAPEANGVRLVSILPETVGQAAESAVPAGRIGEEEIPPPGSTGIISGAKANPEARIIDNEQWWKLRHWEQIRKKNEHDPEPVSAWLFNSLPTSTRTPWTTSPEPSVFAPRRRGGTRRMPALSSILPVVLEENGYEQTHSDKMVV